MKPILIHKSDSTIFANVNKFLTFNLETELDLTGWQAKFILGWVEKTIDDISLKSFEIILDSQDTKQLILGKQYGTIILTDSNGNIKTVTNTIPFEVTTAVVENEYQEIDLTIPESSGVDIKLKVGAQYVTSVNGMTGNVNLTAQDVGALPVDTYIPSIEGLATEEQLQQGLATKQPIGDYATKTELSEGLDTKQPVGEYLTEIPEEYVKNTDYASDNKAGVVKCSSTYGVFLNAGTGQLYGAVKDLGQYISSSKQILIAKGTLENIKDDYVKRGVTENTNELSDTEKASAKQWLGFATPAEIMQAIASIPQFSISLVESLPETGEKMVLYLVSKGGESPDVYDEYIWIEQTSSFEFLGTTAVDLTGYVKNTDYATSSTAGLVRCANTYGMVLGTNGLVQAVSASLDTYATRNNSFFVGKGTLDNVLTQYKKCSDPMTEEAYEALETKDANTLYLIEE